MKARVQAMWTQLGEFVLALPPARRLIVLGAGVALVLVVAWWTEQPLYRLNYQRALQGELGRTIGRLGGVEWARVHLVLPEQTPFVAGDRHRSASVVVKLAPGRTLGRAQIDGIVHLVASSVEGLDADAVTVVDESGRMPTADRREEPEVSSSGLEMQSAFERQIGDRIETMLGAVVGRDKVIARVAASLDFARLERTEETYDPDRSVLKAQRATREQTITPRTAGGTAGGQANTTSGAGRTPLDADAPGSERRDESETYALSKVVSRTIAPAGALKQLSIAVLVDGVYREEKGQRVFAPRPPEEMDRLRELVKGAVGFSEGRGDRLEVACVPFRTESAPAGEGLVLALARWAPAVLVRLLAVAFAAVVLLYVVRPLVLALAIRPEAAGLVPPVVTLAGVETASARLTRENLALTQENPERAAQLVREWLREGNAVPGPGG